MKLGYTLLYVADVDKTMTFYEQAFGLTRRFFSNEDGKQYGELETGAATLGFVSYTQAQSQDLPFEACDPARPAPGFNVTLLTQEVPAAYQRAVSAGAEGLIEPKDKPWGQTVAYVRDLNGFLVELATPLGEPAL